MIVEFFKRGTGGSSGPIDYFLGKDRDREHAKILSGDLKEVSELIDSSPYVKKYTAGCLSFYEDDLSDAKKKNLMAAFEKTLFPGLSQDQYRIVWIEHRDKENLETGKQRLELNFLIPNVQIATGKRLQPFFAKADLNRVDDFKNIVNYKYQLFDPDDPINRRSIKIAKNLPQDKKDFISAMNTEVTLAITEGLVSDRESLKSWMTEIGLEITRITKNQISVKNPNNPEGKPIPLKGEFYEQNFRHSEQSAELKREASERYRREADSRYANCIERYKKLCESKSEYHLQRYGAGDRTDTAELTRQFEKQENKHTNQHRQNGVGLEQGHAGDARELTDSNTGLEKGLADVKRIEPSNSRTSEAEKIPFFIEYGPSFNHTYSAYIEHQLRLRQQKQVQRHQSNGSESHLSQTKWGQHEYIDVRRLENRKIMRTSGPDSSNVQQQFPSSKGDQLNEPRSTIIEYYRGTTTAAQAATANARSSLITFAESEQEHRRIRELQQKINTEQYCSDRENPRAEQHTSTFEESPTLRAFISRTREQFETAITEPFKAISEWFRNRESSQSIDPRKLTNDGANGNRQANETISKRNQGQVGLSKQLSREIRGFNPKNIFTALEELDSRKQQKYQPVKNDIDSPRPF